MSDFEDRTPKLLPVAVSLGLHAVAAAFVIRFATQFVPPQPPPGITVTVDALSTAIAPGADVPTIAAPADVPTPAPEPEVLPARPEQAARDTRPVDQVATSAATATAAVAPPTVANDPPPIASGPDAIEAAAAPAAVATASDLAPASATVESVPAASQVPAWSAQAEAAQGGREAAAVVPPASVDRGAAEAETLAREADQPIAAAASISAPALPVPAPSLDQASVEPTPDAASPPAKPASVGEARPALDEAPANKAPPAPARSATSPAAVPAAETAHPSPGRVTTGPDVAAADLPPALAPSAPVAVPSAAPAPLDDQPNTRTAATQAQVARLETGPTAAAIEGFVARYDGGPCFFASVAHASENGAAIDVLADSDAKFHTLNDTFFGRFGLDPDVHGQHVTAAQCPAVDSLRRSRTGLAIEVDRNRYASGETLTGTIKDAAQTSVALYSVAYDGHIRNITRYLRPADGLLAFEVPLERVGREGARAMLLIAVSEPPGQPAVPFTLDPGFDAARFAMAGRMVLVSDRADR